VHCPKRYARVGQTTDVLAAAYECGLRSAVYSLTLTRVSERSFRARFSHTSWYTSRTRAR